MTLNPVVGCLLVLPASFHRTETILVKPLSSQIILIIASYCIGINEVRLVINPIFFVVYRGQSHSGKRGKPKTICGNLFKQQKRNSLSRHHLCLILQNWVILTQAIVSM